MRRQLLILLLSCLTTLSAGAFTLMPADGSRCETIVTPTNDTLLFFAGNPEMKTSDGTAVDWFVTTDTLHAKQTNSADCYNYSSGDGVAVRDGKRWIVRYVFNYNTIRPVIDSVEIVYDCRQTKMIIPATSTNKAQTLRYTSLYGNPGTYALQGQVSFNQLEWGSNNTWDSVRVVKKFDLTDLPITKTYEAVYAASGEWSVEYDTIGALLNGSMQQATHIIEPEPIAVSGHATSITTIRTAANEVDYPETSDKVTGSAPLNILFKSNPTPKTEFYEWRIYRGNTLIARRTDMDQRYEFRDPGNYRVVSTVSNLLCPCMNSVDPTCQPDSTEINVTISESMLRVPNVFTPNGDGVNDEFRVVHRSLREFHCEIYNRWGKLVFQWDDPNQGWDGNIGGRPAAEGAYYYVIRAKGTDASDDYMSRAKYNRERNNGNAVGVYQLSGDINLLRGKK